MLSALFALTFFIASTAVLFMAARSDWKGMIIPNEYSLALIGLFVFGSIIPNSLFAGVTILSGLLAGLIILLIMLFFYALRAMGGGDTKLAAAVALLIGLSHLSIFVFTMAFAGGVLGVYAIATRKHGSKILPKNPVPNSWLDQLKNGANKIPYGIAISMGATVALFSKWIMPVINGF